jgi:hypothetical protein
MRLSWDVTTEHFPSCARRQRSANTANRRPFLLAWVAFEILFPGPEIGRHIASKRPSFRSTDRLPVRTHRSSAAAMTSGGLAVILLAAAMSLPKRCSCWAFRCPRYSLRTTTRNRRSHAKFESSGRFAPEAVIAHVMDAALLVGSTSRLSSKCQANIVLGQGSNGGL